MRVVPLWCHHIYFTTNWIIQFAKRSKIQSYKLLKFKLTFRGAESKPRGSVHHPTLYTYTSQTITPETSHRGHGIHYFWRSTNYCFKLSYQYPRARKKTLKKLLHSFRSSLLHTHFLFIITNLEKASFLIITFYL